MRCACCNGMSKSFNLKTWMVKIAIISASMSTTVIGVENMAKQQFRIRKILAWMFVCMWMAFIFYLSNQTAGASSELSLEVTVMIERMMYIIIPHIDFQESIFHHYIRKGAHFFTYFILGVLVMNALFISRKHVISSMLYSLVICVIYATTDEIHQLFIPGRSGEVIDVFIDSVGATVGILIYASCTVLIRQRIFKRYKQT